MASPRRTPFIGSCCEGLFTRRGVLKQMLAGGPLAAPSAALPPSGAADHRVPPGDPEFWEDASRSLVPAAAGGPMLKDPHTISLRWLGCSCYELVHRGKV